MTEASKHLHTELIDLLKPTPFPVPLVRVLKASLLADYVRTYKAEVRVQPLERLPIHDALQDLRVLVVAQTHASKRIDLGHGHGVVVCWRAVGAGGIGREESLLGVAGGDDECLVEGFIGKRRNTDGTRDAGELLDGFEVGEMFLKVYL